MSKLLSVKKALCISLMFCLAPSIVYAQVFPALSCGEYLFKGSLRYSELGLFVLRVRTNTSSPIELILSGMDFETGFDHTEQVLAKVRIVHEITSNDKSTVRYISLVTNELLEGEDFRLIKKEDCIK